MKNKYTWIIIELITIVGGTYAFAVNVLDGRTGSKYDAGIGASMIVLGIMLRLWRKEFFKH